MFKRPSAVRQVRYKGFLNLPGPKKPTQ